MHADHKKSSYAKRTAMLNRSCWELESKDAPDRVPLSLQDRDG